MPEGVETRIIVEGLRDELEVSKILKIEIISGRYARHDAPKGFNDFYKMLPLACDCIGVKGKFIFLTFGSHSNSDQLCLEPSMWVTLGMTGVFLKEKTPHSRIAITYQNIMPPYKESIIYFDDVRNFGTFKFSFDRDELHKKISTLGIDLLNEKHTVDDTMHVFKKNKNLKRTLAEVLMDQSCFAGIGNYIKAEALYRARLSPHRQCNSLSKDDIFNLHSAIIEVFQGSYHSHGVTISDYRDIDGNEGKFELFVYGKKKSPCGNPVIKEMTKDKRMTHWVPTVQH